MTSAPYGTAVSGVPGVRWMRVLYEPEAHAVTGEGAGEPGWRPLCQQSDMASDLLTREASNSDDLCRTCRDVIASRVRWAVERRRRAALTAPTDGDRP